jgi:glutaredoxin-dependent peroxiredoxin
MPIKVGQPAPDFTLYNTAKQPVSLSEQKGKNVLLLFFPLAFTSVCTAELCGVRDNIATYNSANAVVFGISVDSPQTLKKFKDEQHFSFELLSDFNKDISARYEALYETFSLGMKGVSKRAAFVLDKEGIIRYAEVLENAGEVPNFAEISTVLSQIGN